MALIAAAELELLWAAVVTSGLALLGVVITAFIARTNNKAAESIADRIMTELDTGNGHTAGSGIARLEDMLWRHENRLDGVEVELRETKDAVLEAKEVVEITGTLARQSVQQMEDHLLEVEPLKKAVEGWMQDGKPE